MRWILPPDEISLAAKLAQELSLHQVTAQVLVTRGYATPQQASEFMRDGLGDIPDPDLLLGMRTAVERIVYALQQGKKIALWGDYDVDGVTSVAILSSFLLAHGTTVTTRIPKRLEEGYGLQAQAVEELARENTNLLITLDCGITANSEIERARTLGLEVIVVDHHQVGATLPPALAVIDPYQPGCTYPYKNMCAAGLTFLLVVALRRRLREANFYARCPEPNLREYLDLAALGTIGDVVPLLGINRIFVKHGLQELAKAKRPGIRALKAVSGISPSGYLSTGQVAFRLVPRLNAAGRLADAGCGVELLTTSDPRRADVLAGDLDEANAARQSIEKQILEEAIKQAQSYGPSARSFVLAAEGWHPGVIGIVAARIVDRFRRPTFVIALEQEQGRGSGRSIESFHLFQALEKCSSYLIRYGGHRHAAGLCLARQEITAFRQALESHARRCLSEDDLVAQCHIDALVELTQVDFPLFSDLEKLGPFGAGNPQPVLAFRGICAHPRILPSKAGGAPHLKLTLPGASHLDVIGFGLGEKADSTSSLANLAFQLGVEEYRGISRLSLKLKDVQAA